jgi:hypothetical protein
VVNKAVAEHIQWVKAMAAGEQSALAQFYEATCAQVRGLVLHILKRKFHPPNQEFAFRIKAYRISASKMWLLTYAN